MLFFGVLIPTGTRAILYTHYTAHGYPSPQIFDALDDSDDADQAAVRYKM